MTSHISVLPKGEYLARPGDNMDLTSVPQDLIDALSAELNQDVATARSHLRFLRLPHPRTGMKALYRRDSTS